MAYYMLVVGNGDDAAVDPSAVQHGYGIVKICNTLSIALRLCPGKPLGVVVANGSDLQFRAFSVTDITGVGATHIADTQNADLYFVHGKSPLHQYIIFP